MKNMPQLKTIPLANLQSVLQQEPFLDGEVFFRVRDSLYESSNNQEPQADTNEKLEVKDSKREDSTIEPKEKRFPNIFAVITVNQLLFVIYFDQFIPIKAFVQQCGLFPVSK